VVVNMADYGMNPQAALDAPRWRFLLGKSVLLESAVPDHVARALAVQGHDIQVSEQGGQFGKGQIILHREGVFVAASEPRADGLALAQ
ncbi:MAG: gamma-glutamyltransferase, partial [Cyanobacteriota bacterium]